MQTIVASDTLQIFSDWGQSATLEEVAPYYDPDTGQMEESVVSTTLTVLAGSIQRDLSKSTAGIAHDAENLFVVQSDSFPLNVNLSTARVLYQGTTFKVETITQSHIPATVALHCKTYAS